MLNNNDMRVLNARRAEMERAARQQNTARAACKPQASRMSWSRLVALFLWNLSFGGGC